MKSAVVLILLCFASAVAAQTAAEQLLSNEFEAACGKPLADGKIYDFREGRVSSVSKDNELLLEQSTLNGEPKTETLRVRLAGIDSNAGGVRLNATLKKMLLGKKVIVAGNKKDASDGELVGSVWAPPIGDLNQHLLRNRLARFSEPDYEGVSSYSVCVLRQIGAKPGY